MQDLSGKLVNDQIPPSQAARELLMTARAKELADKEKEHSEKIQTNLVKGTLKGFLAVASVAMAIIAPVISGSLAMGLGFSALFMGIGGLYGYESIRHFSLRSQRQADLAGIRASTHQTADALLMNQGVNVLSHTIENSHSMRKDGKQWAHAVASIEQPATDITR